MKSCDADLRCFDAQRILLNCLGLLLSTYLRNFSLGSFDRNVWVLSIFVFVWYSELLI